MHVRVLILLMYHSDIGRTELFLTSISAPDCNHTANEESNTVALTKVVENRQITNSGFSIYSTGLRRLQVAHSLAVMRGLMEQQGSRHNA